LRQSKGVVEYTLGGRWEQVIIAGKFLIPRPGEVLPQGAVAIEDGRVVAVGTKDEVVRSHPSRSHVDYGDALITPGFVNYHCHLELEFCRGRVDYRGDFVEWLQRIRNLKHDLMVLPGYFPEQSVREVLASGTTTLLDHYTLEMDFDAIRAAGLRYFGFRELFDFNNHNPDLRRLREATVYSFAIHSPYTASAEIAQAAQRIASEQNTAISMHLSEMHQEIAFIDRTDPAIVDLLRRAGAYDESWQGKGVSPVRYFHDLGVLTPGSYCVHLNYALPGDVELLKGDGITHVYCPRSHAYFGHPLHPLMEYQAAGIASCLGTDSYGSNDDLSILSEARKMWEEFPALTAERVFSMFTNGGLAPLRKENELGQLAPGFLADVGVWAEPQGESFDELVRWLVTRERTLATLREGRVVHET